MNRSNTKKTSFQILFFITILLISFVTGCCTKKKKIIDAKDQISEITSIIAESEKKTGGSGSAKKSFKEKTQDSYAVRAANRKTAGLYKRLEHSYDMLERSNPEGALREVERLQREIRNDPYLEMQSWYLSSMIYHKMGKASRRKRSMRKMLETMEILQKDPRFRSAYEVGMGIQGLIEHTKKKEGKKYAE
jgi:hypothetical protein